MKAPLPGNEVARLEALRSYSILDSPHEKAFDDLARLAGQICQTPIALVSLVDAERQWFKSNLGLDLRETHRELSFCAHAILGDDIFEVEDTLEDPRFVRNRLVTSDPKIRFYAGMPLVTSQGAAIGTLSVIDRIPRRLTTEQKEALRVLARQVVAQLELRKGALIAQVELRRRILDQHGDERAATLAQGRGVVHRPVARLGARAVGELHHRHAAVAAVPRPQAAELRAEPRVEPSRCQGLPFHTTSLHRGAANGTVRSA